MTKLCVAALMLVFVPRLSSAATILIDFEELADSPPVVAGSLVYPEATFTSSSGALYVNGAGLGKDLCTYNEIENSCVGTLTVDFTDPVSGLTFRTGGDQSTGGALGNAAVFVNGLFLQNVGIGYDGLDSYDLVNLTVFANITKLVLTSTDPGGVTWDHFSFEVSEVEEQQQQVPEPTSVLLVGLGLAGLGARRLRPRRTS